MAVSHFFRDWQGKENGPHPWWDPIPSRTGKSIFRHHQSTCLQLCLLCCRTQPPHFSNSSITPRACPLLLLPQLPYLFLPGPSIVFCFQGTVILSFLTGPLSFFCGLSPTTLSHRTPLLPMFLGESYTKYDIQMQFNHFTNTLANQILIIHLLVSRCGTRNSLSVHVGKHENVVGPYV